MNSKNNKFLISAFIVILLISNIATFYIAKDYTSKNNNGDIENLEIEYYTYTNEELGFKINIPSGFELEKEEKSVRLFSEGGPLGNRVTFVDNSREKGKYITIRNLDTIGSSLLETFLDAHAGDPVPIQEMKYIENVSSDVLIKHSIGYIMAFQPRDISELRGRENVIPGHFEISVNRDFENAEVVLKEMFKSFEIISITREIPAPPAEMPENK